MKTLYLSRTRFRRLLTEAGLTLRALLFLGGRFVCPCCGWRLRTFTRGGWSLLSRHHGYCPRCNSKARHRRDWLYLQGHTNLFRERLRLLHVSPKYALSRRFVDMPTLDYVALDLKQRPHTTLRASASSLPLRSGSIDAIVCIHVLEHVADDRRAMREFFRVLRPGGWALITVPVRLDQPTYEDPAIISSTDRATAFGEASHVRFYGRDLIDRLEACGFDVTVDLAGNLDEDTKARYGLLADENIFHCVKPTSSTTAVAASQAEVPQT